MNDRVRQFRRWLSYVGTDRVVRVVLDYDDPEGVVVGTLVELDEYGQAAVDTVDGRRYCWPVLECEPYAESERCPVTELIVDQCAHCLPRSASPPRTPNGGPILTARYDGTCTVCLLPIAGGDQITPATDDDTWVHAGCVHLDPVEVA